MVTKTREDGLSRKKLSPEKTPALLANDQGMALAPQREAERALVRGRGRPKLATKDAILALQHKKLGKAADRVLELVIGSALDTTSPTHETCLKMVVERIAPIGFWKGLSEQEFNDGESTGGGPRVVIQINSGSANVSTQTNNDAIDVDFTESE